MTDFCYSCSAPLKMPAFKGPHLTYCRYCTDEGGNLKSREEIKRGIAKWLQSWTAGLDEVEANERAEHFMKAMPAWAEHGIHSVGI